MDKDHEIEGGVSVGYFGFGLGWVFGYGIEVSIDVSLPGVPCYNYLAVAVGQRVRVRHEQWQITPPRLEMRKVTYTELGMLERVNYVTCRAKCPGCCDE